MNIDIQQEVQDKLNEMDAAGVIRERVRSDVEKSVLEAIDSAVGGYKFKRAIEDKIEKYLSPDAINLGLDSWAKHVGDLVGQLVAGRFEQATLSAVKKCVTDLFDKADSPKTVSGIVSEWRKYIEYQHDDVDDRETINGEGGYLLRRSDNGGFMARLTLGEEPEEALTPSVVITFTRVYGPKYNEAIIDSLRFDGKEFTGAVLPRTLSSFDVLLINAKINKTKILLDWDKVDWNDHFYLTNGDY